MVSERHEKEYVSAALIIEKLFRVIWPHGAPKLTIIKLITQFLVLSTHLNKECQNWTGKRSILRSSIF